MKVFSITEVKRRFSELVGRRVYLKVQINDSGSAVIVSFKEDESLLDRLPLERGLAAGSGISKGAYESYLCCL